jgi:uncharacterized protein YdbL (DUF1318 family)
MLRKILLVAVLFVSLSVTAQYACAEAKYSIKQMTPEVQSALNNRRDRFEQLRQLKHAGAVGENNHGYVEVLNKEGDAQSLASAENNDRRVIYQTIAEQNGLQGALDTIETVFAQVQRDKADSGDKIQDSNGQWSVK